MKLFLFIVLTLFTCWGASSQQTVYQLSSQKKVPFQENAKQLIKRFYEDLLECDNEPAFRYAFISNNIEPGAKFKPDYYSDKKVLQYLSFEQYLQGFIGEYNKRFSMNKPVFKQSAYIFSDFYLTADRSSSYVIVDFDNVMIVSGKVLLCKRVSFYCYYPTCSNSSHVLIQQIEPKEKDVQIVSRISKNDNRNIKIIRKKSVVETVVIDKKRITIHVNDVSFDMLYVEGGNFIMGSARRYNTVPLHQVTLSSYYMGKTEVTQALWKAVMGKNPSYFKGNNLPIENVSWNSCVKFIKELNRLTGKTFRLPTEAEWEYAARGGNKKDKFLYSGSDKIEEIGWYGYNSGSKTNPVEQKKSNGLGLYDMSGNVWEWCSDWYGSVRSSNQTNPTGPVSGSRRVYRGGSYLSNAGYCAVFYRDFSSPGYSNFNLGFRLVFEDN